MIRSPLQPTHPHRATGPIAAMGAFLIWGMSPVYWKALHPVPALEIITHRVVWSFLFLLPLMLYQRRWHEFTRTLKTFRTFSILLPTAILVAGNWLLYVWSVNHGKLLQASLGYYINPLVNVLLGVIFLKERLRPAQLTAVAIAAAGVLYLTIRFGVFPWIAITLGVSFGMYALIRKAADVGALVGLAVETLILTGPAVCYMVWLKTNGTGVFLTAGPRMDLLLMSAALLTAFPLLLFNVGARRLTLASLGFIQYVSPTCMFLLGVFAYGEAFHRDQIITFALIWTALAVYSIDSLHHMRGNNLLKTMKSE